MRNNSMLVCSSMSMSKIIVSHILSVIVVIVAGDLHRESKKNKSDNYCCNGSPELLKGTYFSNSIDENFPESCLSSVCNHFMCLIVLDRCAPKELVCTSLL
jgi:hypothetical protein